MAKVNLSDATIQINLGEAGELAVDVAKLAEHDAVVNYVFQYGLKQMLNDVHASETKAKTPDDATRQANKLALAQKKLTSLYAGEVAQTRVAVGDPVKREGLSMAERDLKAKLPAIGKKVGDFDKAVWRQLIEKQFAKGEAEYRKAAEARLAIKAKPVESIDADDILAMLEEG